MDPSEAVANFVAITGADEAMALSMLEATGYQLEAAVNLFFASDNPGAGEGGAGAGMPAFEDDEALARRLHEEAAAAAPMQEEEVRAPLPVRTERLYGEEVYRPLPQRRSNPVPPNVVDAFRDFNAEAGGAGGSGAGVPSLASMFEPPREMLFQGSFEEAKQLAQEQGRWLIANVQSTNQFASHQLNRDTWRNDMVRELVQHNFVLFQAYDVVDEGQKLLAFYRLYELPAILVVDPVTGAPMRQWTGFIDAERLMEELLPFLDHSIHDPSAARLARRRKEPSRQASKPLTEDEQLQQALAMSMQEGGSGAGASRPASSGGGAEEEAAGMEEGEPEPAAEQARPAAEVQAEAAARLPEEPADGSGCRIAVRLPDGRRSQRRFPAGATLAAVHDLCLSQSEEAAGGRKFTLSQGFPGAPALEDMQQTLEAAGLNGAMLVLKWQD